MIARILRPSRRGRRHPQRPPRRRSPGGKSRQSPRRARKTRDFDPAPREAPPPPSSRTQGRSPYAWRGPRRVSYQPLYQHRAQNIWQSTPPNATGSWRSAPPAPARRPTTAVARPAPRPPPRPRPPPSPSPARRPGPYRGERRERCRSLPTCRARDPMRRLAKRCSPRSQGRALCQASAAHRSSHPGQPNSRCESPPRPGPAPPTPRPPPRASAAPPATWRSGPGRSGHESPSR
mmetsp:Transcript_137139/g.438541  ORF Transcript_137139/g.438541 Transcript_137139/m.438541 type:complete len:234 (-) Transcript_137139:448-1149(-)